MNVVIRLLHNFSILIRLVHHKENTKGCILNNDSDEKPLHKKPRLTEVGNFFFTLLFSCCVVSNASFAYASSLLQNYAPGYTFCVSSARATRSRFVDVAVVIFNVFWVYSVTINKAKRRKRNGGYAIV